MDQATALPIHKDADVAAIQTERNLAAQLTGAWKHAMVAADAQANILSLKLTRLCVMALLYLFAMAALSVLALHGFFLLDSCLAQALSQPPLPTWVAPLTRGILYLSLPSAILFYIWHTQVGFSSNKESELRPM